MLNSRINGGTLIKRGKNQYILLRRKMLSGTQISLNYQKISLRSRLTKIIQKGNKKLRKKLMLSKRKSRRLYKLREISNKDIVF